jgi:hypothetical protein
MLVDNLLAAARQIRQCSLISAVNSGVWLPTIQAGRFGRDRPRVDDHDIVSFDDTFYSQFSQIK